jgi:hypothetical protein
MQGFMSDIQYLGYAVLCCIVIIESVVLRSLLQEALWLKSLSCTPEVNSQLDATTPASDLPSFQANVLDSAEILTDSDLRGRDSLILFLNAARTLTMRPEIIDGSVYALWGKTDECLYICCEGDEQACRSLSERHHLQERYASTVKVLIDDSGRLTALFGVIRTPSAMIFDEDGRVTKTGLLETPVANQDRLPAQSA